MKRALWAGEVFPLCEPKVSVASDRLAGKGKHFHVGDTIQPNRSSAKKVTQSNRQITGQCPCRNDDIGANPCQEEHDGCGATEDPKLVPASGIRHHLKWSVTNFGAIAGRDGGKKNLMAVKGWTQAQKLDPMSTARGDCQDSFWFHALEEPVTARTISPAGRNWNPSSRPTLRRARVVARTKGRCAGFERSES